MTRLILGTAQFGSAYGITNAVGRLSDEAVSELVAFARGGGIDTFDTAADYGDSQARLGAVAQPGDRYITKFSLPAEGAVDAGSLFGDSASILGVQRLAGVMFHKIPDLRDARAADAVAVLRDARSSGRVARVGVSIYDADDLELALAVFPDLDLVQLPGNLLDRRLLDDPRVSALRDSGAEIHVRSAFLQGILLADRASLPQAFEPFGPVLAELDRVAAERGTSRIALALAALRDGGGVDGVVVGATTPAELGGILQGWSSTASRGGVDLPAVPVELLDPRTWPR